MTIEVIDETPDPSVLKEAVCRNCGVRLRYVPADVRTDYDTDYTGSRDEYRFIECPKCKHQVRVR